MGSAAPSTASTPPTSTTSVAATPASPGGVFTDPAGSFEVRFTAAPAVNADPAGTGTSYVVNVDEDSETLRIVAPTAFGASAGTSADERVRLFLAASGEGIEVLANTPTRLGPYPAAYFIARVTLADGRRAVLYGTAVVGNGDVTYVVYTDVGGDDGDRGRAFVESYTVHVDPLPAAPAPTTTTIPAGALVSFDGHWWVRFPDGAEVSLQASSDDGFAYAEYVAVVGDDTLSVRMTELPAAFEWDPAGAAAADAERTGGTVVSSEMVTIGDSPAARFTLADADSETSGDTTEVLQVRTAGQLYRVAYADGGESSTDAAAGFIDSFHLR